MPFTASSTWTWIDHPVSGLHILTFRPVKTWFPFGSVPSWYLTSPACTTRRTVLQKVRGSTFNSSSTACRHRVSGSLSLPSRGPFHLSLTVLFAIGHWVVFRLGGWALRLHTGFHVSGTTLVPLGLLRISPTGISPSSFSFSKTVRLYSAMHSCGPQPRRTSPPVWPLSRSLAAT